MELRTLLLTAFTASACFAPAHASPSPMTPQRGKKADPPPGMVHIDGGRTKIGTDLKEIEKRILQTPQAQQRGNALLSETPRHSVKVDPFFLMVNEVTNEQYAAFVRATGHKPPIHWASEENEKAAIKEFLAAEGKRREEAKAEGKKVERRAFDKDKWWTDNWSESKWEIPKDTEHHPVRYVSHTDAKAYARWAGLRLMSEYEYQRAVRGDTERTYPWGDEFDPDHAATLERPERRSEPWPVGTFPSGAVNGVYDLAGNVWEWTDSPYQAYKGYKPLKLKVGRGKQKVEKNFTSAWDPDARVCVSGSVLNNQMAARATARRRTDRIQTTEGIGFRCAASTRVGQDIAETVLSEDLPRRVRPSNDKGKIEYRTELVLAYDRWKTSGEVTSETKDAANKDAGKPINASSKKDEDGPTKGPIGQSPPPGYSVIEDYDYITFIPATSARMSNQKALRKDSFENQPLPLGVLSTTQPILHPELAPGTYMVGFRGMGERKKKRKKDPAADPNAPQDSKNTSQEPDDQEPMEDKFAWETELGLNPEIDNYVIYDNAGTPIALLPCDDKGWNYSRMSPGTIGVVDVEVIEGEGKDAITRMEKRLQLEVMLEGLTSSKGFRFTMQLTMDPEVLDQDWRTQ